MFNSGLQQQVFQRPKAELCFRPWWDFVEDCALSTMLAIGRKNFILFEIILIRFSMIRRQKIQTKISNEVSLLLIYWDFNRGDKKIKPSTG